ncbi:2-hydroxychromene-2-carboxylate isomerase [Rhodobacteraceae bacterium NNCM2]|nr:2-hydroxychromene-2-carboxylate isomerase [Coraliihabitans acroporae]
MPVIDYYFSLLSPWTYFAGSRLEDVAAKHDSQIAYKPIDVMKVFSATGGLPMAQRPPSRLAYREQDLRRTSAKTGMPYHFQPAHWPTDPTLGSCAVISLLKSGGDGAALSRALLAAVWAEELDIADPAVVADKVSAVGGDPAVLETAIADHGATYEANTQEAIDKDVFGVPFYMVGEEKFWGQDKIDDLDWYLSRG